MPWPRFAANPFPSRAIERGTRRLHRSVPCARLLEPCRVQDCLALERRHYRRTQNLFALLPIVPARRICGEPPQTIRMPPRCRGDAGTARHLSTSSRAARPELGSGDGTGIRVDCACRELTLTPSTPHTQSPNCRANTCACRRRPGANTHRGRPRTPSSGR